MQFSFALTNLDAVISEDQPLKILPLLFSRMVLVVFGAEKLVNCYFIGKWQRHYRVNYNIKNIYKIPDLGC